MVQAFPQDRADQQRDVRILRRRSRYGNHFLHTEGPRHSDQVTVTDGIAVAQRISAAVVPEKRFSQLLQGPLLAWVFGHLKVQQISWDARNLYVFSSDGVFGNDGALLGPRLSLNRTEEKGKVIPETPRSVKIGLGLTLISTDRLGDSPRKSCLS